MTLDTTGYFFVDKTNADKMSDAKFLTLVAGTAKIVVASDVESIYLKGIASGVVELSVGYKDASGAYYQYADTKVTVNFTDNAGAYEIVVDDYMFTFNGTATAPTMADAMTEGVVVNSTASGDVYTTVANIKIASEKFTGADLAAGTVTVLIGASTTSKVNFTVNGMTGSPLAATNALTFTNVSKTASGGADLLITVTTGAITVADTDGTSAASFGGSVEAVKGSATFTAQEFSSAYEYSVKGIAVSATNSVVYAGDALKDSGTTFTTSGTLIVFAGTTVSGGTAIKEGVENKIEFGSSSGSFTAVQDVKISLTSAKYTITTGAGAGAAWNGTLVVKAASTLAANANLGDINNYGAMEVDSGSDSALTSAVVWGTITNNDATSGTDGTITVGAYYLTVASSGSISVATGDSGAAGMTLSSSNIIVFGKIINGVIDGSGTIFAEDGSVTSTKKTGATYTINSTIPTPSTDAATVSMVTKIIEIGYTQMTISANGLALVDGDVLTNNIEITMTGNLTLGDGSKFVNEGKLIISGDCDLTVAYGAEFSNENEAKFTTASTISGVVSNSGSLTFDAALAVTGVAATGSAAAKPAIVENSGILYLKVASTVNVEATIENSGAITKADGAADTLAITGDGTFNNLPNGVVGFPVNTKTVTGVKYDVTLSTDIIQSITYGSIQNVIVPEGATLTIQRTASMQINGSLIVNGTLNVEGELIIDGAAGATMEINGTVNVITNGAIPAKMTVGAAGNPGIITVNGDLTVQDNAVLDVINGAVLIDGNVDVQTGALINGNNLTAQSAQPAVGTYEGRPISGIVVATEGTLAISGNVKDVKVSTYGNVVVDNGDNTDDVALTTNNGVLSIALASSDANVTVESFIMKAGAGLTITDAGLVFKDATKTADPIVVTQANAAAFAPATTGLKYTVLTGTLVFTESATSKTEDRTTTYTNKMDIAGAVSAAPVLTDSTGTLAAANSATATFTGAKSITVSGELTLGAYVALTNAGNLDVSGTVNDFAANAQPITNTGALKVTGLVSCAAQITGSGTITAAYYIIKTTNGTTETTRHNYSTLENAVAAVSAESNTAAKNITIYGKITVLEDISVPKDVVVGFASTKAADHKLIIGTTKNRDVKVTFEDGAKLNSGKQQVEVFGTLVFANKTNDGTQKTVVCDVTVEDEAKTGSRTYTNIYTALSTAQSGQTVTVTRDSGNVELTSSITVPAGVTLSIPTDAAPLFLKNGITVTVDGVIVTSENIYAETQFGITAMNVAGDATKQSSAIVVNGAVMIETANAPNSIYKASTPTATAAGVTTYANLLAGAPIAGAYYQAGDYVVITQLDIAVEDVEDATSPIYVFGAVNAGDIAFVASEDCPSINVATGSITTMGTTVYNGLTVSSLTLSEGAVLNTTGAFTGTVQNANGAVAAVGITGFIATDGTESKFTLTGNAVADTKTDSFTVSTGTVYLGAFTFDGIADAYMTIAAGATAVADATDVSADYLEVLGTLSIPANMNVTVSEKLVDMGTVTVVAPTSTTTGGNLRIIGDLAVGIEAKYTAAAATLSGPISIANTGVVYVAAGSVVDDVAQAVLDALKHTTFYIDNAVWMTVYDGTNVMEIGEVDAAPVKDALFEGVWNDADASDVSDDLIGSTDKVYAVVEKNIYVITVYANEGIANMYIDNNLMAKGMVGDVMSGYMYAFTAVVAAGSHTLTYDLANGWAGTAVFKVNGTVASNNTFTTSGTPGEAGFDNQYNVQTSGIEKAGYVPDSPDTNDGMSITDILLIVLVVLIVVMAIIVAMRMMRS